VCTIVEQPRDRAYIVRLRGDRERGAQGFRARSCERAEYCLQCGLRTLRRVGKRECGDVQALARHARKALRKVRVHKPPERSHLLVQARRPVRGVVHARTVVVPARRRGRVREGAVVRGILPVSWCIVLVWTITICYENMSDVR
jgi:hypothetical protein